MNERRTVWSKAHGPIPKGWVVHNLDGDPGDMRLDNLAAVPREPENIGQVIAPYRAAIRKLELRLKEKENGNSSE